MLKLTQMNIVHFFLGLTLYIGYDSTRAVKGIEYVTSIKTLERKPVFVTSLANLGNFR